MKLIIQENQRGLLFRNGKFSGLLPPGKYPFFRKDEKRHIFRGLFGKTVEVLNCTGLVGSAFADTKTLLADESFRREVAELTVSRGELGIRFVDGAFAGSYGVGMYAFWNIHGENTFRKEDVTTPYVAEDFPRDVFRDLRPELYEKVVVQERLYGLLYIDGKFEKLLPAGRHFFWREGREIELRVLPSCPSEMDLVGQEILTADKVAVRVNCVCEYLVTDPVRVAKGVSNLNDSLHLAVQLALREYIGRCKLDDILSDREGMSAYLLEKLRGRAPDLAIEVRSAAVKDIILPGEIREIMNTVLLAEKRAQASLVTRREEVASTRSLLNTAKLMEENATLYKLKELEYIGKILEHVECLSLGGNGDFLSQIAAALSGKRS